MADDLRTGDVMLRITSRWCWNRLRNRHREVPRFAIIGYGKLGGKELGYGSDLDIVFGSTTTMMSRLARCMPRSCAS